MSGTSKLQPTDVFMASRSEPFENPRHDIYPSISPKEDLQAAARGLRVLITGGGRGVGRCTALFFAEAGAAKIVITARTAAELEESAKLIKTQSPDCNVITVRASVTTIEDVERVFDQAGELDAVVHNAGIAGIYVPLCESSIEDWWQVYEINVKGTYLINRECLRRIRRPGVSERPITIINLTSRSALSTFPGASAYSSAKCAINRLVEYIHTEEQDKVRVFGIHPGAIPTALSHGVLPEKARDKLVDTAELAAGVILWLATQKKADFLRGRYMSANWDVDEVCAHQDKILQDGLLLTTVTGGSTAWS